MSQKLKFQLLAGTHYERTGRAASGTILTKKFTKGDIVVTEKDLVKLFGPEKFKAAGTAEDDEADEGVTVEKGSKASTGNTGGLPKGAKDVTETYTDASKADLKVFRKGKNETALYFVADSTGKLVSDVNGLQKTSVKPFLKEYITDLE